MNNLRAIENFAYIREHFPFLGICACGDFATIVKPGPETGKPFHLCAEHSSLWTKQRLGIQERMAA